MVINMKLKKFNINGEQINLIKRVMLQRIYDLMEIKMVWLI